MNFDTASKQSNLDRFLQCTTPTVRSQLIPKIEMVSLNRLWHPSEAEKIEYFTLNDLWDCYDEWSAYGAGVPITLDDNETLVQYYVPYLSAIQIFTSNFRDEIESGDGERSSSDCFSDSCSTDESESDKLWRSDGCCSSEQDCVSHFNNRLGYLYFQYFETSTPYERVPLMDKINGFSRRYPGLTSLRSVDLSPASWMAVSWYPIYHIPMGRTIKDFSTCFLTYHTLSSSFQETDVEEDGDRVVKNRKGGEGISLPPFGLATYKMQGNVWLSPAGCGGDQERLLSLLSIADSWLKQLCVQHHDFDYFSGIRRG
ncbi:(RS)-norcoclaurine 6-O-methyltransferase-like isoform 1 [Hibiscus syriacus]|uniref:(RS)-norcoclaurine 6-O-methyltransferase-like isoform 1 n=1 Tax=Hibiscus syriacus TaxID=106335 RepID=A0A6A2XS54_HIBSY|nr:uncharacterized protein LOC120176035 [Hibiscus syriacus]KAE8669705.1 (RS)-norcoclaurine 6-O-methyltransferase-like isoform 1 [Hibiscus syriacus]